MRDSHVAPGGAGRWIAGHRGLPFRLDLTVLRASAGCRPVAGAAMTPTPSPDASGYRAAYALGIA
ncbi:hypothetical protein OHA37_37780 [Streptomyces sp. NBC_00335]|uniref:hypothetical protein n=1 Tax=unclassified Streptomyces TaxID=2593676 RepID=UPI00224F59E1|nr:MULTISPECIES: hypothetical protein [unclassified Streptomyces]MCX5409595.1 hypothetical protein [Streptomyces sp. NBC_00086]